MSDGGLAKELAVLFGRVEFAGPRSTDIHSVSHPDHEMIIQSVSKTGRLLVADTSWPAYGLAAEINRIINERDPRLLSAPSKSLGMQPSPCPTAKTLEDMYYPDVHDLVRAIVAMVSPDAEERPPLPPKQSMTDFYKHFKGPF